MIQRYILVILLLSGNFAQAQRQQVTHYNIIFAPDLSNRLNTKLYPKPVSDAKIVSSVLSKIYPDILRIKRLDRQMDKFSVDFINRGLIGIYKINTEVLNIDFGPFQDRQLERIDYIMGRSKRKLSSDVTLFNAEYARINAKASLANHGADIWTYFNSGIDGSIVKPAFKRGNSIQAYRNILILMTDGYIEAGIYGKGYDLSKQKVDAFRKAYLKSRASNLEHFLGLNPQFKINPVNNQYLKNLEVLVLEMYDRSLSKSGAATIHPTDMEIMKVIWSDWLRESGIKHFELKSIMANQTEIDHTTIGFIKQTTTQ
ncbi:hypothetical protein SAMN04487898_10884 [Pedobacter sp. ok626]|uniref:hypothetical protein n=1 Tax=Pedobacter sp. ok626 TaxID=1761882 RepID=UPI00088EC494|nr:hypothetical protein [Pedobacter sp. ok626]SDK40209.1 hypothetical protein SAMN04487898_10884 [Pedobacter sp. ok626]